MRSRRIAGTVLLAALCGFAGGTDAAGAGESYDLAIEGATLVDGTGAPARHADVLVRDGKIAFVGDASDRTFSAAHRVDAGGRVLAPGFIDMHAHGDPIKQSLENFVAMGVTTIVLGQDGRSPRSSEDGGTQVAAWMEAADRRGVHANVALLSGHGTLRQAAGIPDARVRLSASQEERLLGLLRDDLEAGAFGMSTGLEYVPGLYAEPEELIALAELVGAFDGVVMSHMRSEDDDAIERSIEELLQQGEKARVHVSHLKIVYGRGAERAERLLDFIAERQREGARLSADAYPYTASYTGIAILFPEWALSADDYGAAAAERRDELASWLRRRMTKRGGPEALLFGTAPSAGKTLAEAARDSGQSFVDFLIDAGPGGGAGAHFIMDAEVQDRLFANLLVAVGSDGGPGMAHPRGTGTFARLIEHYVVERELLTLEQAVYKATGLPARIMGFSDRGTIRPGNRADLVLFDPARVAARSDYVHPDALAEGFDVVVVNGRIAWDQARVLRGRFGEVLRQDRSAGTAP